MAHKPNSDHHLFCTGSFTGTHQTMAKDIHGLRPLLGYNGRAE